ncbi:unnamed protein product [Linum tenue]|uniref:Uncharacterized protein n=1 Tax=Linum tenue TaxID=586396 RepID=A0AAV0PB19_9ROSI|nr:unnamed protein product [Linum tenue]
MRQHHDNPRFRNPILQFLARRPRFRLQSALDNRSPCASCTTALSRLQALYFPRSQLHSIGNISDGQIYPWIYTAAVVNPSISASLSPSSAGVYPSLLLSPSSVFTANGPLNFPPSQSEPPSLRPPPLSIRVSTSLQPSVLTAEIVQYPGSPLALFRPSVHAGRSRIVLQGAEFIHFPAVHQSSRCLRLYDWVSVPLPSIADPTTYLHFQEGFVKSRGQGTGICGLIRIGFVHQPQIVNSEVPFKAEIPSKLSFPSFFNFGLAFKGAHE